jgi:hypothetical protein
MAKVMEKSGWSKNQANGVVGFQVGADVYVLEGADWTTLHELVHKAGINADRLNRFVAEGLTEVIASELGTSSREHRPTYPAETRWVKEELLPRTGMGAQELGRFVAHSAEPHRDLARLVAERNEGVNETQLRDQLRPQRPDAPGLGCKGRCTIPTGSASVAPATPGRDRAEGLGGVLLVSGLALVLPNLVDRWMRRSP